MSNSLRVKLGALALLILLGGVLWRKALRDRPPATTGLSAAGARGSGDLPAERLKSPLRVLFVGNSYTYVNDLPAMIRHLAGAGGNRLRFEGVQECPGGFDLRRHWESGRVVALLQASRFDWMVLQDQSEEPSFDRGRLETDLYPFVSRLRGAATSAGARTILFMTWGHKGGDPENVSGDSYAAMQSRLAAGYEGIAGRLDMPLAPVGVAWRKVASSQPALNLWQGDGSHPSAAGTYLAACVFYDMFYGRSPLGNDYRRPGRADRPDPPAHRG